MWVLGRLMPDFKTIAHFRKENVKGIDALCRQFVEMGCQMIIFYVPLFAIDGGKFKAVNNKDSNVSRNSTVFGKYAVEHLFGDLKCGRVRRSA
ncbi:ISPsy6, transposase [Paraglaciecola psychrophila 170]|jgi:transposase|uniref:ISPsy6, transposase n=1 Tax=Paraglaciecola psychrophila 170 TaxID=1129794 RepID=K7ABQ6_9ALTE|nr:ISPsy6, transposase [Paraglaciecola psychrophila 170]GAC39722.1 hypothetical protein GPSY_4111 [Paraglaciecola psychrophila 170]